MPTEFEYSATKTPQYPIESVDNALKLLLLLGDRAELRLTEASEYLGVASSTAHRLLAMLQYRGFVRQDSVSKTYGPGAALTGVAFSVLSRMNIGQIAHPILQDLNDELNETVHVSALEQGNVRFIDGIESRRAVRTGLRVGMSLPAHCTSVGKAMLAQLSDEEVRRVYPREDLPALTEYSITTFTKLLSVLESTRRAGFATNREESEEGVASVAVAVPTSAPGLHLGLNVSAPASRFPRRVPKETVKALQQAAERLAALTG